MISEELDAEYTGALELEVGMVEEPLDILASSNAAIHARRMENIIDYYSRYNHSHRT